ncbi:MAG: septation protein IspZ [Alcanivoracaceae bacterium]|jgi:intracellular septation protein|nr:septation protein IspZ [Alcanivoracaceae bacterium]
MKQAFDYLPVIVFFALYFAGGRDIFLATWGIIIACTVQVTAGYLIWRKVERMHLVVFVVTLVFGTMTLFFRDDTFIKWRPSIISFTLGTVLLFGHFISSRNLLQRMIDALMASTLNYRAPLTRHDWSVLNLLFVGFFLFVGALNLFIAYRFDTDFWVTFKLFGFSAIQMLFYLFVMIYIYRKIPAEDRARLFESGEPAAEKDNATGKEQDKDAVRDHQ